MSSIKSVDSEVVFVFSLCLCEMIWQNRCCRINVVFFPRCLLSEMINVLGLCQGVLPNADSTNKKNWCFDFVVCCNAGYQRFHRL